ncbi:MAG: T9SS type A sorting domain-containing protein [Saprospiraceae bacterium]|nr:T9SS type A sorting domain-containing protein [Saprospiraceae bacterium]
MKSFALTISACLFLFIPVVKAQENWSRFYELENPAMPGKNGSHALLAYDSGFVLLNGANCNMNTETCGGLHRLDRNGGVTSRSPFSQYFQYQHFPAFSILHATDGNFVTTGLESLPGGSDGDMLRMWVMKIKPDGDTLWVKNYDNPNEEDEDANDILTAPNGDGYYLQGDEGQDFDHFFKSLTRINNNGDVLWKKEILNGERYMMQGNMELLVSNDKIAMAYASGPGAGHFSTWVTLTDTLGNIAWSKRLITQTSTILQPIVRALPSGNMLVFCSPDTIIFPDQFPLIPYFYEIDTQGVIVREGHLSSIDKTQHVLQMRISEDGNILICGRYIDHITDKQSNWVAKVDLATWQPIWQRFYALPQHITTNLYGGFIDVVETPWGGLACAGKVAYPMSGGGAVDDIDAWVITLDNEGCFKPGCSNGTYTILDAKEPVSMLSNERFLISPNPASEQVEIKRLTDSDRQDVDIQLYNLWGETVSSVLLPKGDRVAILDLLHLPAGPYFLQCYSDGHLAQSGMVFKIN